MREYKFRGKTEDDMIFEDGKILDKGTWVYGSLIVNGKLPYIVGEVVESDSEYIALEYWYPCDPNTIGQFTGLKDKNGKEIYEGDIVKLVDSNNRELICNVEYITGSFWYVITRNSLTVGMWEYHNFVNKSVEVIGNIHEVKKDV